MNKDEIIIIIGLIVGVSALAGMIGFIGQGNIREDPLYYPKS